MSDLSALAAVTSVDGNALAAASPFASPKASLTGAPVDFSTLLSHGLSSMDAKIAHADDLVARFALDDNIPVHQVTIALEEARLSVELAMQVRQRFVEGYKDLMNMQL